MDSNRTIAPAQRALILDLQNSSNESTGSKVGKVAINAIIFFAACAVVVCAISGAIAGVVVAVAVIAVALKIKHLQNKKKEALPMETMSTTKPRLVTDEEALQNARTSVSEALPPIAELYDLDTDQNDTSNSTVKKTEKKEEDTASRDLSILQDRNHARTNASRIGPSTTNIHKNSHIDPFTAEELERINASGRKPATTTAKSKNNRSSVTDLTELLGSNITLQVGERTNQ